MSGSWIPIRAGLPGSDEPMSGLGDLAVFLGGDETSFTGRLLDLIVKAQATPENLAALRRGFPDVVRAWQVWMRLTPSPTAGELRAALDALDAGDTGGVPDVAVQAVLEAMGWPDDRDAQPGEIRVGTYWDLATDVARAARAADLPAPDAIRDVPGDVRNTAHLAAAYALNEQPYARHGTAAVRHVVVDRVTAAVWRAARAPFGPDPVAGVLAELAAERGRQDEKWQEQNHADGTGRPGDVEAAAAAKSRCQANGPDDDNWRDILDEEITEAYAETVWARLRPELVQAGAVIANWVEAGDRRAARAEAVDAG